MKPEDPSKQFIPIPDDDDDDDIIDLLDELDQALGDEIVSESPAPPKAPREPAPKPAPSAPAEDLPTLELPQEEPLEMAPPRSSGVTIDDIQPEDENDIIDLEDISDESLADVDDIIDLTDGVQPSAPAPPEEEDEEMVDLVDLVTQPAQSTAPKTPPAEKKPAPDLLETIDMLDLDSPLAEASQSDLEDLIDLDDISPPDRAPEPVADSDGPRLFDDDLDDLSMDLDAELALDRPEPPPGEEVREMDESELTLASHQELDEIQIDEIEELDFDDMLEIDDETEMDDDGLELDMELDLMGDTVETPNLVPESERPAPPVEDEETFTITSEEDIERELGNLIDEQLDDFEEPDLTLNDSKLPDYAEEVTDDSGPELMDGTIDFLDTQDLTPPEPFEMDDDPDLDTDRLIVPADEDSEDAPLVAPAPSEAQMREALRDVVREMFAEKIEPLLMSVVEEVVSQEINRLKQLLADSKSA